MPASEAKIEACGNPVQSVPPRRLIRDDDRCSILRRTHRSSRDRDAERPRCCVPCSGNRARASRFANLEKKASWMRRRLLAHYRDAGKRTIARIGLFDTYVLELMARSDAYCRFSQNVARRRREISSARTFRRTCFELSQEGMIVARASRRV